MVEKTTDKKWKCLYLLSAVALVIALILAGSWLTSDAAEKATQWKKALAIGFFVLSGGGFSTAKVGSWFFHK